MGKILFLLFFNSIFHFYQKNIPCLFTSRGQKFSTIGISIQKPLRTPIRITKIIVIGFNINRYLQRRLFSKKQLYH